MEKLNQLVKDLSIPENVRNTKLCPVDWNHDQDIGLTFDSVFDKLSTLQGPIPVDVMEFICRNGTQFLKKKRFVSLGKEIVEEIVQRDDLFVQNEALVLEAVIRWGQNQCSPELDKDSPTNFGPFIANFLPHLRHPCDLTLHLWAVNWKNKSQQEVLAEVLTYHKIQGTFNPVLRQGCEVYHMSFARVNDGVTLTPRPSGQRGQPLREEIRFLVNCPLIMYAFTLAKGVFGENFTKNEYDYRNLVGKMELSWENEDGSQIMLQPQLIATGRLGDKVEFSHGENPVDLVAGKWISLSLRVSGYILETRKSTRVAKKIWLEKANILMANGLSTENKLVYMPMTKSMNTRSILPRICIFRRDSLHGPTEPPATPMPSSKTKSNPEMGIRQGFIDEVVVSYNRCHQSENNAI